MKEIQIRNSTEDFLVFSLQAGESGISVRVHNEDVWLTQKAMGELFGCSSDNIGLHLKKIFEAGELDADSVTEKISATASDGKRYMTKFYSLDAIISVGYRVNSLRATQFRQWATQVLNEEEVLHDKGRVSAEIAKSFAESEFEKYRVLQDRLFQSDFDRLLAQQKL